MPPGTGRRWLRRWRWHRPDVVLMDVRMPGVDGLTATEALRRQSLGGSGFDSSRSDLGASGGGGSGSGVGGSSEGEFGVGGSGVGGSSVGGSGVGGSGGSGSGVGGSGVGGPGVSGSGVGGFGGGAVPEVIVLTTFDTDEHVRRAIRAGASGLLLKHTPPAEIARAVRRVAAGEPMLSPEVLRRVMGFALEGGAGGGGGGADPRQERARGELAKLSPSERQVASLVAEGRANREIGTALRMSTTTVKTYVSRSLTKLDLANRTQIALVVHDAA